VPSPHAELSSLASMLEDVAKRVTEMAESASGGPDDWLTAELFEVERSLGEALRRLSSISGRMRR
jgi:hypothetical protein